MNDTLYQAHILDHCSHPRNRERLDDATVQAQGSNPSCGDSLTLYVRHDGTRIVRATFEGQGCAISQATASMLTEKIIGMSIEEAKKLSEEDIYTMLGVEVTPARQKCALLAWHALQEALATH